MFQIKSALKAGSIAVKKEDLEALRQNSIDSARCPAFVLDYRNGNIWVAIELDDFLLLTENESINDIIDS